MCKIFIFDLIGLLGDAYDMADLGGPLKAMREIDPPLAVDKTARLCPDYSGFDLDAEALDGEGGQQCGFDLRGGHAVQTLGVFHKLISDLKIRNQPPMALT
ncbi:MAG: hypothetical protein JZU64_04310 [Rhodoferax sp.]|nr:hypothetical protein [Rhodoferax sp.]